ncbi:hypothetical protein BDV93DRAFT_544002, partial [Ceratobasidium sp. AG-I]
MDSGNQQPGGFSMADFDGKQSELVQKLSEISTSMRQCAEIVDSFSRVVRQLSFRPAAPETAMPRQHPTPGPSRAFGYSRSERPDPTSTTQAEAPGPGSSTQSQELYRRSSHPYVGGSMHPPAVPPYHSPTYPIGPGSSSSPMHAMPGPPTYPLYRPGSATSGLGSAGAHETVAQRQHGMESVLSSSERQTSSTKSGKRKRLERADLVDFGDDSDPDTPMESSPKQEPTSELDEPLYQPGKHVTHSSEGDVSIRGVSSRGAPIPIEGSRSGGEPVEHLGGPSIVVFSSGAGSSRPRTTQSRGKAQTPSMRAKREKKPRDPNAPKQPPPAYIVYQNEMRESMRARFPTHSPTELVKEIAATWKTLTNAERQRYKDYANVEKDRWITELAAYQATLPGSEETAPAKSSEGSFLASAAVSDSPPASSPRQSPRLSDTEADTQGLRRVASQDTPSGSAPYEYHFQAPLRGASSFPGAGVGSAGVGTSSPRVGGEAGPSRVEPSSQGPGPPYGRPPAQEHARARPAFASSSMAPFGHITQMPPPSASRSHFAGPLLDPRPSSNRLPSFDSLGLGQSLKPKTREQSPAPPREHAEEDREPAPKRQRTQTNPPSEDEAEEEDSSRPTYEGRE